MAAIKLSRATNGSLLLSSLLESVRCPDDPTSVLVAHGSDAAEHRRAPGEAGDATGEGAEGTPRTSLTASRRAVYGLYAMYAIVGLIYGFVSNYINIPICQYVFGPMDAPGRASLQQCNVASSVTTLPWNFKVFYGLFLDNVTFFGSRRRGWIIFGWTASLLVLTAMSFVSEQLANDGNFATYMWLLVVVCVFYIFADVAGDGLTIEFSKLEAPETRGYILTTGQLVRFAATCFTNILGTLAMNGKSYYPAEKYRQKNDTVFPFELSFGQVHLVLVASALPLWLVMVFCLEDPPETGPREHHSAGQVLRTLWISLKTKVLFMLIVFSLGNMALASLSNPAANIVATIAEPSVLQNSVGTFAGNVLFLVGVWIFRNYLMNVNWRLTFVWTTFIVSLNCGFQLLVIYNAWGIGQTGWFYAFGSNALNLIQGVAQVLSSLAVVEISPSGYEASMYEFLTTMHNAGITLNANLQNLFTPMFNLNSVASGYATSTDAQRDDYNRRMANATYFTLAVNLAGALLFCWCLPWGRQQCREWLDAPAWRRASIGGLNLAIAGGALLFSMVVSILSSLPETDCLQIAGGPGC